ncbi:MAG: hypothetical protein K0S21_2590 [Rhizobiaceae bacterium]|jgi:hypothetical protein|nr:hypothetical protein [Rhizobiaceae bacterium]
MAIREFMPPESVVAAIRSDVERYESQRVKAWGAVQWRVPLFLSGPLAATVLLAIVFNRMAEPYERWITTAHVVLYVAACFAAIFIYRLAMAPATALRQSFRSKVLPLALGFIEDVEYRHGQVPDSIDRLPREASGSFSRQTFDDVITGRYEGFRFELYEADLRKGSGKSETVLFKGVIVAFETMAAFPGLLVAVRKAGAIAQFFRGLLGTKVAELQSGQETVDGAYEFHTDNPDAARPLVTGRLPRALLWLAETWPEERARVALKGSDGFLLLPLRKNFFEIPGISVPLDYVRHVEPIVADVAALLATAALVRKIGAPDDASANEGEARPAAAGVP